MGGVLTSEQMAAIRLALIDTRGRDGLVQDEAVALLGHSDGLAERLAATLATLRSYAITADRQGSHPLFFCGECGHFWADDEPEDHALGCLVALTPVGDTHGP